MECKIAKREKYFQNASRAVQKIKYPLSWILVLGFYKPINPLRFPGCKELSPDCIDSKSQQIQGLASSLEQGIIPTVSALNPKAWKRGWMALAQSASKGGPPPVTEVWAGALNLEPIFQHSTLFCRYYIMITLLLSDLWLLFHCVSIIQNSKIKITSI